MKLNWDYIRRAALERDKFICAYCVDDCNSIDHIIPRSRGGSDDPSNLVAACQHCNSAKGALTPWEWHVKRGVILPPWWIKDQRP